MFNGTSWRLTLGNVSIYPDRWMPHLWYKLTLLLFIYFKYFYIFQVQHKSCDHLSIIIIIIIDDDVIQCFCVRLSAVECRSVLKLSHRRPFWITSGTCFFSNDPQTKQKKNYPIGCFSWRGRVIAFASPPYPTPEKNITKEFQRDDNMCDLYI